MTEAPFNAADLEEMGTFKDRFTFGKRYIN